MNRGDHWDVVLLPVEAQMAPSFSIHAGDLDGDGAEDLFMSQNFSGTASDLSRDDAGRGLCLRGSGRGSFTAIGTDFSGIRVLGEQRGAALADFNHDGRVDLAVSQNNGPTRLFVNQGARPGIRVELRGPAGNPDGIGSQLRLILPDGTRGPCRSIQAGSGYGSQDAPAQILGFQQRPRALWVRWPGGREQTVDLADPAVSVRVDFNE